MAVPIDFDIVLEPMQIEKLFENRKAPLLSQAALQEIADFAVIMIIRRTKKGRDVKGRRFKMYSRSYEKYRAKQGLSKSVTLQRTGRMLNSLVGKGGIVNAIVRHGRKRGVRKLSRYHNEGTKTMPKRRFLGIDEGTWEYRALVSMAADKLAERISNGL